MAVYLVGFDLGGHRGGKMSHSTKEPATLAVDGLGRELKMKSSP